MFKTVILFALSLPLFLTGETIQDSSPKNVLFIAADDLNCDLACYGHSEVATPHLDRLAAQGVLFDRAYCQQPLCGPSRASIMTGLRPDTLDMHTLKHELRIKNPDVITLGQLFRQQGYFSARSGKIYHYGNPGQIGTPGNDDPETWDETDNPAGIDKLREDEIIKYNKGGLGISMAWWDPVSLDEEHTDGMVATKVIEWMKTYQDKPFFLAAGFYNPHCPYVAPKRYFDLYPLDTITVPDLDEAKKDLEDVPAMAIQRDSKRWPYYFDDISEDQARRCKQAYYASISFLDAQVGRLMDALHELGLMEKTIIVFWSDHGYFLGEKGLWYKRKAFERSARAPLLIAGPGIDQGTTITQPVELLDLYPTLADFCRLPTPENLEGLSLRPLLTGNPEAWTKPAALTQIWHNPKAFGYSLRTERYRYTEWMHGEAGSELYDHQVDGDEVTNLAMNPAFEEERKRLSAQLRTLIGDQPSQKSP